MLGGAEGVAPGSPSQQTSATAAAAAEVKADRLARDLEEAEEEISAMLSKIKQQVDWAHFAPRVLPFTHQSFAVGNIHRSSCLSASMQDQECCKVGFELNPQASRIFELTHRLLRHLTT